MDTIEKLTEDHVSERQELEGQILAKILTDWSQPFVDEFCAD